MKPYEQGVDHAQFYLLPIGTIIAETGDSITFTLTIPLTAD